MHTCRPDMHIYKHLNMQLPIYVYVPLKLHARQPMLWVSSSSPSPSRSPKTVTLATLSMLLCPPWSCVAWGVAWNSRNEARRSQAFSRYTAPGPALHPWSEPHDDVETLGLRPSLPSPQQLGGSSAWAGLEGQQECC